MACKLVLPSNEIIKLSSFPQSFDDLLTAIRNRLEVNFSENFLLKYIDADKELVNLTSEEDFQTAKLSNEAEHIKTLKVFILPQENPNITRISNRPMTTPSVRNSTTLLDFTEITEEAEAMTKTPPYTKYNIKRSKTTPFETTSKSQDLEHLQLTNDQLEVINNFIGLKIKSAVEENMKNFLPKFVTKLPTSAFEKESTDTSDHETVGPRSCPIVRGQSLMFKKYNDVEASKNEPYCNECEKEIIGVKYICLECSSYKCCEDCEGKVEHQHPLLKVRVSSQSKRNSIGTKAQESLSYSMFISPEKTSKGCVGNLVVRRSLTKSSSEKKPQYCGKIYSQNASDVPIKTAPSQEYNVVITIKNTGIENWPKDVKLCCVNGIHRNAEEKVMPLETKATQTMHLSLEAPSNTGKYLSQWKLYYNDGEKPRSFGESLFIEIQVEDDRAMQAESQRKSLFVLKEVENEATCKRLRSMNDSPVGLNRQSLKGCNKKEKIANYLNEIFPGNLDEKFDFLGNFTNVEEQSIEKIVESYLLSFSKSRTQNTRKSIEIHSRQRHELSLTL